ncbi:hypothetical protein BsWGS_04792 [Bradybaena similaris]
MVDGVRRSQQHQESGLGGGRNRMYDLDVIGNDPAIDTNGSASLLKMLAKRYNDGNIKTVGGGNYPY